MFSDKFKFRFFLVFSGLIFIAVVVRLVDLQVIEGEKYTSFVNSQISSNLAVSKNRGWIYDVNGDVLAKNRTVASLYAFGRNIDNFPEFTKKLSKYGIILNKKVRSSLTHTEAFTWIVRQIDLEKARKMAKEIHGLEYFKEEARFYPQGSLMANIIGFTGVDNEGRAGVEYALNSKLAGEKVTIASLRDSRGSLILFEDKSDVLASGTAVYLTISARLQSAAEYMLKEGAVKFGAKNGAAIALDVKTGDILFAADVQSFNPQNYSAYPKSAWKNQSSAYVYEPGSIFKTVAFSYLADSKRLDKSRKIDTSKKITISGYTYSDTKDYGVLSVDGVYTHSSNIGTATLIKNEKKSDFYAFLKNAGFGAKTGTYGLPEESGVLRDVANWSRTSLTSIAIGYEVMVTPLQMARFYAAIANDGVMMKPRVIDKIVQNGKTTVPTYEKKRIMSSETAKYMLELMRKTVESGTGIHAGTTLTKVAGKTGTASIYDSKLKAYSKTNYSASFAGVFPAEDPKIAMVVVYDSPTTSIYGGSTAANVFRQIAEFASTEFKYAEPNLRVAYADK